MFQVGQKVVCVDDASGPVPAGFHCGAMQIIEGDVYTVRWVGLSSDPWQPECLCIRLVEITDRWGVNGDDVPYASRRFRPAVQKKTDIAIFTAMLTPKKVKAPA